MKYTQTGLLAFAAAASAANVTVNPLPKPISMDWGDSGTVHIANRLRLEECDDKVVRDAFDRAMHSVYELKWTTQALDYPFQPIYREGESLETHGNKTLSKRWGHHDGQYVDSVGIKIRDSNVDLQLGVDESYSLEVPSNGDGHEIKINANTTWGALHAITTLQQLVVAEHENGDEMIIEQPVKINDYPLYPHRAIMLDSARHYLTVESMLRQLDGMALSKLNVLHWHLADSESWPVQLDSVPMSRGAYSRKETYSKDDVKRIVDYAYARGVRVVPELDSPGHSFRGWHEAEPEVLACATSKFSNNVNNYQLDILNNQTYNVLAKVYDELSGMFRDDLFHVGADELVPGCFNYSAPIQNWLAQDPSRGNDEVLEYWIDHAVPIFNNTDTRRLMMWEDVVLSETVKASNVPKNVIMQSWNGHNKSRENMHRLTEMGYDVVASSSDFLYLDCGPSLHLNGKAAPNSCAPYKGWQYIYGFNFTDGLDEQQKQRVLGAEATLFAEQVDSTTLDQKVWPRAAALGELTWSGNKAKDGSWRVFEMAPRLNNFREYLVANGINAVPIMPKLCVQRPHHCDYNVYMNQIDV